MNLKVIELNKFYGNTHAVKDVSFELSKSGLYLLAGPNGSGKSTLMEMLTKIIKPSSGEIIYDKLLSEKNFKMKVGILLQENGIRKNITVEEELLFISRTFNKNIDLDSYLYKFELEEHRHKKSQKLSGGLQRRLLVATLFIPDYDIIFFDEPTSGLDVQTRDFIWSIIKEYSSEKVCIVSDHYLNQAASYSDFLLLMKSGELIFQGTIIELLTDFKYKTRIQGQAKNLKQVQNYLLANGKEFEIIQSGLFVNYFIKDEIDTLSKSLFEIGDNVRKITVEDVYLYLSDAKEFSHV